MNVRENLLRAVRFDTPDYIPITFGVNLSCWLHYPKDVLNELMESHKLLFPDFEPVSDDYIPEYSPVQLKNSPYRDPFGCLWQSPDDGITGVVISHPLADWKNFNTFTVPDPESSDGLIAVNWDQKRTELKALKASGKFAANTALRHGHTFLQLCDLRCYENLLFDMMDENPMLDKLIAMLEEFNLEIVKRWLDCQPDMMMYPDDLGMQKGPMLPVDKFRKYIKPSYEKLMRLARERNIPVHMHSDGDIRDLADDLIEAGVEILNLQDAVNGIDWIKNRLKGKIFIHLDIDRQNITFSGTPFQIDEWIRYEVETLGDKNGGLRLDYGLYPGVPIENIKAVMDAMEKYAGYFS